MIIRILAIDILSFRQDISMEVALGFVPFDVSGR
jgi:hypothetical protein